eukprot:5845368-Amphidinium_carterae.1
MEPNLLTAVSLSDYPQQWVVPFQIQGDAIPGLACTKLSNGQRLAALCSKPKLNLPRHLASYPQRINSPPQVGQTIFLFREALAPCMFDNAWVLLEYYT